MLKRSIAHFGLAAVVFVALSSEAVAQTPPSTFSYQGRVYQSDGVTPVNAASVIFTISIYAPDGLCLLYQETQVRNMSSTAGMFSFNVGSGTNTGLSPLSLVQAFDNLASKVGASGCTYAPAGGDTRRLRFSYYDGSNNVTMPSDQIIQSVPYAWTSTSLQGFVPSQFVQTSAITTQTEVDAVFTNYTQLMSLINGTSSTYAKSTDLPVSGGTLNLSSGGVIVPTTPATSTSAVNETYADGHLGGKVLNLTGLASGETLVWNGSTNNWQVAALNSGTVTSVTAGTGLSGGTITGTGTIALAATGTTGTYTKVTTDAYGRVASGTSLSNTDIPAPTGDVNGTFTATTVSRIQGVNVSSAIPSSGQVLKYNSSTSQWEPNTDNTSSGTVTSVLAGAGLSGGTITTAGTISLPTTGTAGTYTKLTTDAYGRVTLGTNANVSDLKNTYGVSQMPNTICTAATTLSYLVPSDTYTCTPISIISSQVSGLGTAAAMNVGTSSGTVAAGNDSRLTGALQSSATAGGDLSGTYASPTVAKINGVTLSSTAPSNGQVLEYNSSTSQWTPTTIATTSGTVTSITAGSGLSGGVITGSGTISLPTTGTAGTYTKVTTDAYGRVSSATTLASSDIPAPAGDIGGTYAASIVAKVQGVAVASTAPTNGQVLQYNSTTSQWAPSTMATSSGTVSSITAGTGLSGGVITGSGTIALASTGTAGTYTKVTTDAYGRVSSATTLANSDIPAPAGDVSGTYAATVVSKVQGVAVASTAPTNGQVLQYNSTTTQWVPTSLSLSSGTVTSIVAGNGLSGGTITSSGTIALPSVGTAGTYTKVTTDAYGRVSSATTLASSDIPAPAGDVSGTFAAMTVAKLNGVTLASTAPTSGQVLQYNSTTTQWVPTSLSLSSGTVTSIAAGAGLSGGTITSSGTISLPTTGTAGTYTKVTTDAYGRVSSATTLANSDIPAPAGDVSGTYAATVVSKVQGVAVASTAPTSGQVLQYNSTTTQWVPTTLSMNAGTVTSIVAGTGLSGGTITGSGTIALSSTGTAGTYTKVTTDAYGRVSSGASLASADIPAPAGDVTGTYAALTVSKLNGVSLSSTAPASGQVLQYNSGTSSWTPATPTSGTLTSITAGSGLSGGTITGSGTISLPTTGTAGTYTKVTTDAYGRVSGGANVNITDLKNSFSVSQMPNTLCTASTTLVYLTPTDTYTCTSISITSSQVSGLGGAATLSVGTTTGTIAAGDDSRIVGALQTTTSTTGDLSGTYGSTTVAKIRGVAVASTAPASGQVLAYNSGTSSWTPATPTSGTVTSITAGSGLSGGTITGSGTISLPTTGTAGTYTKVTTDAYGRVSSATTLSASDIPAPAGDVTGTFAAMSVVKLNGVAISTTAPTNGQVLQYNSSTTQWTATTPNAGTVTSITAGTGLTGGTISSSGTVAVNVGTSASQIVQLDSSARLPAVDGSQLINLPIPFSNATVVNTTGTNNFTVPANVTKLFVQVWGGGGGGAGGTALSVAGTGGASGGFSSGYVTVTPGAVISYTVGAAGTAGAASGDGVAGGASNFSTYFTAGGGAKGSASVNSPTVGGSAGGTSGVITVVGGGGNGAGAYVVGLGSQGGSGGHAGGGGGAGGGGSGSSSYAGGAGSAPGGGGGGGASTVSAGSAGGAGAAGRIVIWY